MTPEQITSLAALNQALEERDAEIAALKAELAAVAAWGKRAYAYIEMLESPLMTDYPNRDVLDDAPASVRGEAATPPGDAEHEFLLDVGIDTD